LLVEYLSGKKAQEKYGIPELWYFQRNKIKSIESPLEILMTLGYNIPNVIRKKAFACFIRV